MRALINRLLMTVVAFAALVVAPVGARAGTAPAAIPDAPPRLVVVADGGAHRRASQGSYCWDGGKVGICADTIDPIEFAPRLRAPSGPLTIRMGYPVESLSAYTPDGEKPRIVPLDDRNRRFELTFPDFGVRPVDLHIAATYDRGDGLFAIRIRPR